MGTLRTDLKRHNAASLCLLLSLAVCTAVLVVVGIPKVVVSSKQSLLTFFLFAFILGTTSARHPIRFPGTRTSVSLSEMITFLAVLVLGPYHAALLAAFDMLLVCGKVEVRPSLWIFNVSNVAVSTFVAGNAYIQLTGFVSTHEIAAGISQRALEFATPLIGLAFTHYALHIMMVSWMARLIKGTPITRTIRDTFKLECSTFLAAASAAGIINYSAMNYGVVATGIALILVIPVPIIIYYTFKAYEEKLTEQQKHYQEMSQVNDSILQMLAMAIDAKDQTTHEHIQRVRLFASRMGELVGLSEQEIEALKAGSLLHDIGKIGVPAYILNKPGKLTEHEFEQMKMHTIIGSDMLSNVKFRYPVVPIVRHHHERWDGKGYPDGLLGEEIPVTARILTLVDNYDALRSDRPYHRGMTRDETLEYVKLNSGTFFDPKLVDIFLSVIDDLESEAASMKADYPAGAAQANGDANGAASGDSSKGMRSARPAAGFATPAPVNRAAAALNSIAETNQRVAALYEMSRTLASSLSLEDTVAILANRLSKMIPFTTLAVSLFDPSRSEFEYVHAVGRDAERFIKQRLPVSSGITGWVIQHHRPMYNTNPVLDLGFLGHDVAMEYKTTMVFPLVKNRESLGAIALYSAELDSYPSEYVLIMETITQPASDSVHNALAFERAQRALLNDSVTGLTNMRSFAAQFERERSRSRRFAAPVSLLMLRANNLESTAVRMGTTSEQILTTLAGLMTNEACNGGLVARHSSDAFLALLPETGAAEAADAIARINEAISRTPYVGALSVSVASATSPDHGETFEDLLNAANVSCENGQDRVKNLAAPSFTDSFLH